MEAHNVTLLCFSYLLFFLFLLFPFFTFDIIAPNGELGVTVAATVDSDW